MEVRILPLFDIISEIDLYGFCRLDGSDWWFCEQDLERISA